MPEDIPEPAIKLTEDEKLSRASDWSDYRKDYGVSSDERELKKQHSLFCAGWDEGFVHGKWAARKDAAAHAQAENDKRLGRWRWPDNPEYVVYPRADHVAVVNESSGNAIQATREQATAEFGLARAARAYFDAHPEPKPWHNAKPGEVWVLRIPTDPIDHAPAVVSSSANGNVIFTAATYDAGGTEEITLTAPQITYATRIWPEDAS